MCSHYVELLFRQKQRFTSILQVLGLEVERYGFQLFFITGL